MLSVNQSLELLIDLILKIEYKHKYFVVLKKSMRLIVKQLVVYKNEYLGNAIDVAFNEGNCVPKETNEYKIRVRLTTIKHQFQLLCLYKNNPTIFKHSCRLIRENAREATVFLENMLDIFLIPKMPVKRPGEHQSHFTRRKFYYEQQIQKLKDQKKT